MVKIDETRCIGCGVCANICPDGIKMEGEKARIKNPNADCLKDAADACPQNCIIIGGENEKIESNEDATARPNQGYGQGMGQGRGIGAGRGRGLGRGSRDGRGMGRGRW